MIDRYTMYNHSGAWTTSTQVVFVVLRAVLKGRFNGKIVHIYHFMDFGDVPYVLYTWEGVRTIFMEYPSGKNHINLFYHVWE